MNIGNVSLSPNLVFSNISDILSKLNVGDVIKAQVVDISVSEVMLKLFDGTSFTAATMSSVDAKPGDVISLSVKNKNDNQIILETVKLSDNLSPSTDDEIVKKLTSLDIKPDVKSIEAATVIKKNDIPLNKDIINKVLDLMEKAKDITPAKALFFAENKIEATPKNMKALNSMLEGNLKVGASVQGLIEEISSITDPKVLKSLADKLVAQDSKPNQSLIENEKLPLVSSPKVDINIKIPAENKVENNAYNLKNTEPEISEKTLKGLLINNTEPPVLSKLEGMKEQTILRPSAQSLNYSPDDLPTLLKPEVNVPTEATVKALADNVDKNIPLEGKLKSIAGEKNTNLQKNTENVISENLKIVDNSAKNPDKEIIHKSFEKLFVKVDPEASKDINPKEIYKELFNKLEIIKDTVLHSSLANKDNLINKVETLQDNIKFLNDINQQSSYIQIPLNMLNKNTTGEIYVLKRDTRRKRIDPDNVTLFISLDTKNMGKVESLIGVDRKSISINLRLTDQKVIDFIKQNYKGLYDGISERGYRLVDVKYRLIDEAVNLLNLKETVKKSNNDRTSIDFRI
jgi:hypothetical protein